MKSTATGRSAEHAHTSAEEFYTCPMHPTVRSKSPGACPVCNMSLVKVSGNQAGKDQGFRLTPSQRLLANIEVQEVKDGGGTTAGHKVLTGEIKLNQNEIEVVTARVAGRIDKLYIRSTGAQVEKGQALYQIYSEQLVAAQQQYLLALQQEGINLSKLQSELAGSARQKLLLWGMTEGQIKKLRTTGKPDATLTYFSPVAGTVLQVLAQEGSYVQEGSPMLQVGGLHSVWVQAQLYPEELNLLSAKPVVKVVSEANPNDTLAAEWVLNNPALETGRQINLVTFKVQNTTSRLAPGQMAYVLISEDKPQINNKLRVPVSAVIPGEMPVIWVENPDSTFQSRMVTLGAQTGSWVEVLDGIHAGEKVVVQGTYLLNSEYILKGGGENAHQH